MSLSDGFLTLLQSVQTSLFRIGGLILLVFGVVSCIINLIVFTQKNQRKSPCSIYLIAVNVANFLYIVLALLFLILTVGYGTDLTIYNLFMCRFYYYRSYLFDILSPFYLILASIDRVIVTSSNARTRQKSTLRLAYICIGCGTLFWIVFHCHALFLVDIQEIAPGYFMCYARAGRYTLLLSYYSLFVKAIAVPLLMIIFGICTAENIRKLHQRRIAPLTANTVNIARHSEHPFHAKDRRFVLMVVADICIYIACNAMLTSLDKEVSLGFMCEKGYLLEIDTSEPPDGCQRLVGADVSWISKFPVECEFLIARKPTFEITEIGFDIERNCQLVRVQNGNNLHSNSD
ncbi:unnamed protein product [Adineta steineri]|uniref:G-protein coupled receptors family 1 profile domain-containing protein n=1 Tax=Adineta steineri TaxID=433720 RepID=A0A814Y6N7_9BILA|nr:unnamed protein product [Adineta steineri]CAF1555952.1 unnamed protein product [Adineta steineri]